MWNREGKRRRELYLPYKGCFSYYSISIGSYKILFYLEEVSFVLSDLTLISVKIKNVDILCSDGNTVSITTQKTRRVDSIFECSLTMECILLRWKNKWMHLYSNFAIVKALVKAIKMRYTSSKFKIWPWEFM